MNRFLLILLETGITMSKPETMEEKVRRLLGTFVPNVAPNSELERYYYGQYIEAIVELAIKEAAQPTLWDYIDATENQQKGLVK